MKWNASYAIRTDEGSVLVGQINHEVIALPHRRAGMIEMHINRGATERVAGEWTPQISAHGHLRKIIKREPTHIGGLERMSLQ